MPQPKPRRAMRVYDGTRLTLKAWRFLEQEMEGLGTPLEDVMPGFFVQERKGILDSPKLAKPKVASILEFRKAADSTPTQKGRRKVIVEQAELLFDHLYPHMPFKTDRFHFVHPRVFLQSARAAIDGPETEFHACMVRAFSTVR